eukprot:PhM_4_TR5334/c0_g1_i4/m.77790
MDSLTFTSSIARAPYSCDESVFATLPPCPPHHPTEHWDILTAASAVECNDITLSERCHGDKNNITVRFVCVSDTHNAHRRIFPTAKDLPDGDIFVHAGDFTDVGQQEQVVDFNAWLGEVVAQKFKYIIVIAGNHDLSLDENIGNVEKFCASETKALLTNCIYLENTGVVFPKNTLGDGVPAVHIFGSPYQPRFYDWAFNLERGVQCRAMWETFPTNIDVLITHGPPLGHGDMIDGGVNVGCKDLLEWVETFRPKAHVFGHVHEGYGVTTNRNRATIFANASSLDEDYSVSAARRPIVFDVDFCS